MEKRQLLLWDLPDSGKVDRLVASEVVAEQRAVVRPRLVCAAEESCRGA